MANTLVERRRILRFMVNPFVASRRPTPLHLDSVEVQRGPPSLHCDAHLQHFWLDELAITQPIAKK